MSGQNCREPSSSDDGLPTSDTKCSMWSPVELVFEGTASFDKWFFQKTDELDLQRLLLQNSNNPPALRSCGPSGESFSLLQQSTDPLYYKRPLVERVEIAFCAVEVGWGSKPTLLHVALGESATLAQVVSWVDTSAMTILHVIAVTLARRTRMSIEHSETHGYSELAAQEHRNIDGRDFTKTLENELLTS